MNKLTSSIFRYGRKTAYILGLVIGGLIGLCRALAINYYVFLGIEFAVLLVSGGAYNSGYIIGKVLSNYSPVI